MGGINHQMDFLSLLAFALPAYVANSTPVLFPGKTPLDLNATFSDGRRVLGKNKTVRGALFGISAGFLVGAVMAFSMPDVFLPQLNAGSKVAVAFLLSVGAIFGDALGSFAKRRMGFKPGTQLFLADQTLFIIFALAFASAVYAPSWVETALLLALTVLLHIGFNLIAHRLKLKKVPW